MEQLKKMGIDIGCGVSLHKHPNMNNGAGSGPLLHNNGYGATVGITGPGMNQYTTRPAPLIAHPPVAANPAAAAIAAATAAAAAVAANVVATTSTTSSGGDSINMANFTAPILISPRYTEQMQKRKLLWSSKKSAASCSAKSDAAEKPAAPLTTTNKWEQTKFVADTDGKVASKFLRLMGMKDAQKAVAEADGKSDVIQQQNEMFTTMQHQYDVARQVTHTMRGMGLGFGSQRQF